MKFPREWERGYYHCTSRVIGRSPLIGPVERDAFVEILREYETFCEVKVLTYCVMSDHFHILVEVPRASGVALSGAELVAKLDRLTGSVPYEWVRERLEECRRAGDETAAKELIAGFQSRLRDMSWFVRLVKQRFSGWYNRQNGRRGTLWEERFKSVMVEGEGDPLGMVAAYIDLNPVRAGLVADPKDYKWSGFGEAMSGRKRAREGLRIVASAMQGKQGEIAGFKEALELYRARWFGRGASTGDAAGEGRRERTRKEILSVLRSSGKVPADEYLRCRVRYFVDGAVLGSKEFVDEVFGIHRKRFGKARKTGARKLRGLEGTSLYALRALQVNVFS